ncbi:MAG TPA: CUAEP/CCAEP-tail radical SAM protein [Chthonomonadales bacterium]|nr:CUAEP/CCAEP-tail radical SAM protein [Chthonomonadales bacterium]
MRSPGALLLLSCYELGHQPLHLATLTALLRRAGYAPTVVDTAVEPLADDTIIQARFVGIAVPMHTALRLGELLARRIRLLNPSAHICFYGLYATLNEDYLLRELIDSAIGGEYEQPLLELVAALENSPDGTTSAIPGVSTRQQLSNPRIVRAPLVMPERAGLPPLDRYARLEWNGETRIVGYAETTRGCKHTCQHCPITPVYQGRFFATPADRVLADIRAQIQQGAQHITFGDPDFLNGPTHALRTTHALHQEFPEITFDATIKIEHLLQHRHLLPEFKQNGCIFVVSAVESLNDEVLARLEKGHTSADVADAFELMERVGIALRPSLMPFSPWETLASYIRMLNFIEERHLIEHIDPVHLSIRLLIPPGSALLNAPDRREWLRELAAAAYTYRWQHPDPHMDMLHSQICALVEEAQRKGADPIETFFHIKALALAMQGQDMCVSCGIGGYGVRKVIPHLTETWFC